MQRENERMLGLKEVELSNDDLFIRKQFNNLTRDSKILVDETHYAILIKDGEALETIKPGVYQLYDKKSIFSKDNKINSAIEIFYISKTAKLHMYWGTPNFFDVHDPKTKTLAKMSASGELEIRIKNPRQFYFEVAGSVKSFSGEDLKDRIKGRILSIVEESIPNYLEERNVSLVNITEDKYSVSCYVQKILSQILLREYGLETMSFTIGVLNLPDKYKQNVENNSQSGIMSCPMCGAKIATNSKFCNNCGFKIVRC